MLSSHYINNSMGKGMAEVNADTPLNDMVRLMKLAVGFLLLYTAYFSTANVLSLVLQQNGYGSLGFYSVGMVYISWGIGGIFSTTIVKRLGPKLSIFLGSFSNAVWIFSHIATIFLRDQWIQPLVWALVFAASMFNGFFNGPMWVAAVRYVFDCAVSKDNYAYCLSVFWVFFVSSQIVGNSLASYVFFRWNQLSFFCITGSLATAASFYFCQLAYEKDKVVDLEENLLEKEERAAPLKEDLRELWQLLLLPKMRLVIPQIFFTGMSISYYTGLFVPMIYASLTHTLLSSNEKFA